MDHTADKLALLTPLQTRGAFTAANCRRGRVGISSHLILLWRRYCTGSLHVITFFQSLLTPSMAWHPAIIAAVQIWINNHCQNRQSESLYVKYPSLFCLFMWTSSLGCRDPQPSPPHGRRSLQMFPNTMFFYLFKHSAENKIYRCLRQTSVKCHQSEPTGGNVSIKWVYAKWNTKDCRACPTFSLNLVPVFLL